MYSTWWLIVCVANFIFATSLAHPAANSPVSVSRHLKGTYGGVGGVAGYSSGQCILHDPATTTTCSKTLITYITVTVPAADVQNSTAIVS